MFPFGILAQSIEVSNQVFGRYAAAVWLACVAAIVSFAFAAARDSDRIAAEWREKQAHALTLWISECAKPIDECYRAWDDGYSLKKAYLKRIKP